MNQTASRGATIAMIALLALRPVGAQSGSAPAATPTVHSAALTLDEVVRAAVLRHPLIDAAAARVDAARGMRRTAGVLPNPVLTWQVENAPLPGKVATAGITRETSTFATLPLEPLWQRGPRVRRAAEDVRAAEADLVLARRMVALDAARAFFRAALAQVSVHAVADVEDGLDSLVRYSEARVKEGAAAEGDLIRLHVERDRVATERVLLEMEWARARGALIPMLDDSARGRSLLAVQVADSDSPPGSSGPLEPLSVFSTRALSARPDVLASRARALAAGAESSVQRTLFIRQLGATFGSKSVDGASTMIAGLSMPFPLFDQNRGEMQRARGERVAAERELAWTERQALAEVAGAYESARLMTTPVAALQSRFLSGAAENRRIAVAAYQEGAAPLLQVIDATRTLADARMTYARALHARLVSLLELYAAAGLDPVAALTVTPRSGETHSKTESKGDTP